MVQDAFFNWLITAVILKALAFLRREVKFGWVRALGAALIAQILLLGFVFGVMISAPWLDKGWPGFALALTVPVMAFAFGITVVRGSKGVKSVLFTALLTWAIFQGGAYARRIL